jgi:hypothetical protein
VDTLQGDGPWVIGIKGNDYGNNLAAMFVGVTLNDQPFTATGVNTTKFKATAGIPPSDWLNPNFDDSEWAAGSPLAACTSIQHLWGGDLLQTLREQSSNQTILPSWLHNCFTNINEVYFRVVIPQNDGQFPPVVFPLYEMPIQMNQTNVGYVNIPSDFSLSFEITPKEIISESGSIIHLTGNGKGDSRLPAIWFLPNTNNLHYVFPVLDTRIWGSPTFCFQQMQRPKYK